MSFLIVFDFTLISTFYYLGNIENIIVKIDDEEYALNELAVISKKNPHLIAINMSDFPEVMWKFYVNILYNLYVT